MMKLMLFFEKSKSGLTADLLFGKLNYNVRVTNFEDNKDFYETRADEVIDFCEKRKISYHIKYGTKKEDNKKTEKIFRKDVYSPHTMVQNKLC